MGSGGALGTGRRALGSSFGGVAERSAWHIGVDTGGTFTDLVGPDGSIVKLPSTPADPGAAIREGVERLRAEAFARGDLRADPGNPAPLHLAHGTTVATNAVLEGTLARVAQLGTSGFADLIEIGRQNRPSLADHFADRPPPLVARRDRLDVAERLSPTGEVELAPEVAALPDIPGGVEALAVCLLHSDLNPKHEELVAQAYREAGWDVTASHELSPLFREYERASTTVMNAALRPRVRRYLEGLAPLAERLWVMTSAGGLWPLGGGRRPCRAGAVRTGRRGSGCSGGGERLWVPRCDLLRHGWHLDRRLPHPRRRPGACGRPRPRRLPGADAVIGCGHRRGGGRVDRVDRRRRSGHGRPPVGRRTAGPGRLRTRWHRADGDRRQRGAGPHPRSGSRCAGLARRRGSLPGVCPGGHRSRRGPGGGHGQHGGRAAQRQRGPRCRPVWFGPGRLRWRRAVACL